MTLWIDIETRSRTDLKKLGVYRYTEDPDFSILMAGWRTRDMPRAQVALGHEAILEVPGLLDPEIRKVARLTGSASPRCGVRCSHGHRGRTTQGSRT